MAIIFTMGVNDQGVARVNPDARGKPNIHVDGNCAVLGELDLGRVRPMPVVLYGPGMTQPPINLPVRPSLVFNQISDADSHQVSLGHCQKLCQNLVDIPVINHPDAVLATRRGLAHKNLGDIPGLRVPLTLECKPESPQELLEKVAGSELEFPVIVRMAGFHNANKMVLLNSADDLDELHVLPFDGSLFYAVEFIDTSDDEGIFYKSRIVMIGGDPVPRHTFFGKNWIMNSSSWKFMQENPQLGTPEELIRDLEERRIPKARDTLAAINQRLGMDFYGIDCAIDEGGGVVLFEANANMNILLRGIKAFNPSNEKIRSRLTALLEQRSGENFSA
jgi:glutathione synthase/RimK-type ligase-like ATP-grasp enzyme